ncbi:MAG: sulfite reductase [Candidatus Electrothrix sp. AR5]|nr:sulfite reductase [Candidatus Electrothrix sp. AR5]
MAMSVEEVEAAIIEKATKSPKPQLYVKDFYKCDPDSKPRAIKNIANGLVKKGELMFWSSGSTTMYARPDRIKDEEGSEGIN